MKTLKLSLVLLFLTNCSHTNLKNPNLDEDWTPLKTSQYKKLVKNNTRTTEKYNGLHMSFKADLTFLKHPLSQNMLKIKSQYKYWNADTASEESKKLAKQNLNETTFFLSLYTPQVKKNKLDQPAFGWSVVLIANGQEFRGKISQQNNLTSNNKLFFPHVESWSKNYLVSFETPLKNVSNSNFQVKLISPRQTALFKF